MENQGKSRLVAIKRIVYDLTVYTPYEQLLDEDKYNRERRYKTVRNSVDKSDTKIFDQMFSPIHVYNSVVSYAVKAVRLTF